MKLIDARDYQAEQSWNRLTIIEAEYHRLRVKIRYNAYAFQSFGRVEKWSGTEWKLVAEIPYPELEGVRVTKVSYMQDFAPDVQFAVDEDELFELARAILDITEEIPSSGEVQRPYPRSKTTTHTRIGK